MNTLIFHCSCLDGNYTLKAEWTADELTYTVDTDIEELSGKTGELDPESVKGFLDLLEKAGIPHWERRYVPEGSGIEDAVRWNVEYVSGEEMYRSSGEETFLPYGYETLIDALESMDKDVRYFSYR
ncbi:MAG: hypothetical protein II529_02735 [Erysipelotrichaceae bacterium]|jgi:predicted Rdx family selenoprotein|nr:hypothetical protein [Erysipelotrichaceae bacterium]MBQ2584435.1 hypothetical protein [Erysipelotrichaceae bacterium]